MSKDRMIIKVSKEELNQVFECISKDNFRYGLILKLVYVYGRSVGEVLKLQNKDIDLKHNAIDFMINSESFSFPIHEDIKDDLLKYLAGNWFDGFLFVDEETVVNYESNSINKYLASFIRRMNKVNNWRCPSLMCIDFKRLRGQHLFMDGVDIMVINDLFKSSSIQGLKKTINYDELLKVKFPCSNIDKLFHEFTDLNLFYDNEYCGNLDLFSVTCEGYEDSVIVEYDYVNDEIMVIGGNDKDVALSVSEFTGYDKLHNLSQGNYKFIDGFKVMKM